MIGRESLPASFDVISIVYCQNGILGSGDFNSVLQT
jgi:hypothetical protein